MASTLTAKQRKHRERYPRVDWDAVEKYEEKAEDYRWKAEVLKKRDPDYRYRDQSLWELAVEFVTWSIKTPRQLVVGTVLLVALGLLLTMTHYTRDYECPSVGTDVYGIC